MSSEFGPEIGDRVFRDKTPPVVAIIST